MPNAVNFGGRQVIEPGVYSQVLGLVPTPAIVGTFGNIMLIDTGSGAGYGGGSGISGTLQSNGNSIYSFTDPVSFKKFIRGGLLFDLVDYLWTPSNTGLGPQKLYYARAATTVAATMILNLVTGSSTAAGSVTVAANSEGPGANGVLNNPGIVSVGYGALLKAGINNPAAFILQFFEGTFKGLDPNGIPYDGIPADSVLQNIVAQSPEFTTTNQLIAWMQTDTSFQQYFTLTASTAGTAILSAANLTNYATTQLFTNGAITYSLTSLQTLLNQISDLDNSMFICDDYGVTPTLNGGQIAAGANKGALSTFNQAILAYINSTALYTQKCMYVGGGQDSTQYTTGNSDGSQDVAQFYNSPAVVVVHSAVKVPATITGSGLPYKYNSSLYHAGMWCGRAAGLEPQVPITYKDLRIIGLKHEFTKSQRETALFAGVGHCRFVQQLGWVINQGINTMQLNASLVYNNGTSPEISIMRIIHQINKELKMSMVVFVGGNLVTSSAADILSFVQGYLLARTATAQQDNLIISYNKVTVTLQGSAWNVTYCIVVNGPINRIFLTGFIIDPSISLTA